MSQLRAANGMRPIPLATLAPAVEQDSVPPDLKPKPPEPLQINSFKPDDTNIYEKSFIPKPIPHSPKISPSSIPNPNPSVTTNKPSETGYPNYGGYLYSVPGFSAFQPVSFPGIVQPNPAPIHSESNREYIPFPSMAPKEPVAEEKITEEANEKSQTDFEEHFTPEVIPAASIVESNKVESKMSITSLAQTSGNTVTVPSSSVLPLLTQPTVNVSVHSMTNMPPQTTAITPSQDMKNIVSPVINTTLTQNISNTPLPTSHIPTHKTDTLPLQTLAKLLSPNMINQSSSNVRNITSHNIGQTPSQIPVTSSTPSSANMLSMNTVTPPPRTITTVQPQPISTLPPQASTVTIPFQSPLQTNSQPIKETKKKPERFSLKTSIPISKIDMKCVNPPDPGFQNSAPKKPNLNTTPIKSDTPAKIEIQSNIVIKSATKESEVKSDPKPIFMANNSISALLNAAEVINKNEAQFRMPESRQDVRELKDLNPSHTRYSSTTSNIDRKVTFPNKSQDTYNEQKNQILFIQNKPANPKMLLTIQQQNPQVLLQRTNFDPKNQQAPSRLSSPSKKCKEDVICDNTTSKVVALKRLHQDNYDENDFENLITENQIYGNKIVVKEKSQGTLQEQELTKNKTSDKSKQSEAKNVVLQSNFLYLSNVQFPANLMMIKNNTKLNQSCDTNIIKVTSNENKTTSEINIVHNQPNDADVNNPKQTKTNMSSKEIHVLKSNNNVLQTTSNKNNNPDIVIQANQKVIMNPQIVYQMPAKESDNKVNQTLTNRQYANNIHINDTTKQFENTKNDKLYIACPYQMDAKLQPKIVITNIRPKVFKSDEISALDIYEKKKEMKRLKHLSKITKETQRVDRKYEKSDISRNIITAQNMKAEIFEEFSHNMKCYKETSDSDSDYDGDDLRNYEAIIKEFGSAKVDNVEKVKFLASLNLATQDGYKDKEMERQERMLRMDSVAAACIAAGRLDKLANNAIKPPLPTTKALQVTLKTEKADQAEESGRTLRRKQVFLSQMKLLQVSTQYKEEYEITWQKILIDRKRRYGTLETDNKVKMAKRIQDIDANSQLQLLTEIKKCVNENNNLIKKRLDSVCSGNVEDSIRSLAEKNFSELNRLSKMADRSVKLFSGQDMKKRDLNPGFDSENIQGNLGTVEKHYQSINIPNISKIIALKSVQENSKVTTTQATSMDEPQNSAAGVNEMFKSLSTIKDRNCDVSCQADEIWPGVHIIARMYKNYNEVRKREVAELQRRNTSLRVEGVHITRAAACESDRAQVLLAERQHLALEENRLRASIQRLRTAIEVIRNS